MTTCPRPRARRRSAPRARLRMPLTLVPRTPARSTEPLVEWQRGWWLLGVGAAVVTTLGFQALSPSRRLSLVEAVNARQDSVFTREALAQRQTLDTIRRQLGQLLAGQCVKERDRMARVVFGCGG